MDVAKSNLGVGWLGYGTVFFWRGRASHFFSLIGTFDKMLG